MNEQTHQNEFHEVMLSIRFKKFTENDTGFSFCPFQFQGEIYLPLMFSLERARNLYVRLSGIRHGLYINTRVSPPCFEQGERHGGTAGAAARDRIYGFPVELEAASWIMLAVEEEKLRAATRLIGILFRSSNRRPRS